jgi:hypothetical protein
MERSIASKRRFASLPRVTLLEDAISSRSSESDEYAEA